MKILVTAFEPFGGNDLNSSWEVVSLLPDEIDNCVIVKELLPVNFMTAGKEFRALIEKHLPDVVVSLGQSRKFAGLSIERVALNLMDSAKPDNYGYMPQNEPIHADGDIAYMTTIPIRRLVDVCKQKDIPAQISNSAGTFVCNRVYYEALYFVAKKHFPTKTLFVHLPYITEQEKSPSMDKVVLAEGIAEIIKEIGNWQCETI